MEGGRIEETGALNIAMQEMKHAKLTKINALEESQVKSGSNEVATVFWKENMATIVALVDSFQNIRTVIRCTVVVALYYTGSVSGSSR